MDVLCLWLIFITDKKKKKKSSVPQIYHAIFQVAPGRRDPLDLVALTVPQALVVVQERLAELESPAAEVRPLNPTDLRP